MTGTGICAIKAALFAIFAKQMSTRFDLNLLRVLVALHRWRSVSKAAEELDLSQPATSLALGRLRTRLEDPLFVRSPSGMLPTPRCTELADAAAKALAAFEGNILHRPTFEPATARRDFVVTMADVGELHFLPRLMARLARAAPQCNLRCETFPIEDIELALEEGRCDLALGFFPNLERPALYAQQLFMHSLVCLVRADHPHVRSSRISMRSFLELSHAVVEPMGRSHELFEGLLKEKGYQRRVQLMSVHFLSIPAIIAATDLIVTVPQSIADYYVRLENLRIVEPPINIKPYALKQFWHPRFHTDPAVRWLRESVIELFSEHREQSRAVSTRSARS
ncbi:LysR family transcriptional regulator [Cupriavidus numazuensis]|uniref:LysR family transcriptional regulator n=1 Tax=Cupriavidus numazuensis TaxID=221992 RepID=UPI001BA6F5D8|nr:LysR family transcriptional regulator [Cupriavidus numazuensis]